MHVSVDSVPGALRLPLWDCVNLSFFPSTVLQPGSPGSQGGGAANAGTAVATIIMTAIRAAVINKLMRLITLCILSLLHPPQRVCDTSCYVG